MRGCDPVSKVKVGSMGRASEQDSFPSCIRDVMQLVVVRSGSRCRGSLRGDGSGC